jgi:hypothetical protein
MFSHLFIKKISILGETCGFPYDPIPYDVYYFLKYRFHKVLLIISSIKKGRGLRGKGLSEASA